MSIGRQGEDTSKRFVNYPTTNYLQTGKLVDAKNYIVKVRIPRCVMLRHYQESSYSRK